MIKLHENLTTIYNTKILTKKLIGIISHANEGILPAMPLIGERELVIRIFHIIIFMTGTTDRRFYVILKYAKFHNHKNDRLHTLRGWPALPSLLP